MGLTFSSSYTWPSTAGRHLFYGFHDIYSTKFYTCLSLEVNELFVFCWVNRSCKTDDHDRVNSNGIGIVILTLIHIYDRNLFLFHLSIGRFNIRKTFTFVFGDKGHLDTCI